MRFFYYKYFFIKLLLLYLLYKNNDKYYKGMALHVDIELAVYFDTKESKDIETLNDRNLTAKEVKEHLEITKARIFTIDYLYEVRDINKEFMYTTIGSSGDTFCTPHTEKELNELIKELEI